MRGRSTPVTKFEIVEQFNTVLDNMILGLITHCPNETDIAMVSPSTTFSTTAVVATVSARTVGDTTNSDTATITASAAPASRTITGRPMSAFASRGRFCRDP